MSELLDSLATYVAVLSHSTQNTRRAEDRDVYVQHLAAAAQMFLAVHAGRMEDLRSLVSTERHGYGWGYLSFAEGVAAEKAFDDFAKSIDASAIQP